MTNNIRSTPKPNLLILIDRFASICIILFFLALLMYSIWTLDRGFEITDESYYILSAINPSAVKLFFNAQHWVNSPLWSMTGTLFGFRAIGLVILLFTSAILAWGTIWAFTTISLNKTLNPKDIIVIFASTLSGALLYGSTINFSPCYNLLSAAAAYAAIGFVFLATGRSLNWRVIMMYSLAGSALAIAILSKFTAGIAILGLMILLILFLEQSIKSRGVGVLIIMVGMVSTLLLFVYFSGLSSNAINEFRTGMMVYKQVITEDNLVRLQRYLYEFFSQVLWSGIVFVLPLIYFSVFSKSRNFFPNYSYIAIFCTVLLACIYLPKAFTLNKFTGITASLSTLLALSLIMTVPIWTKSIKFAVIIFGLFLLPYCAAFGTGNNISTQIIVSLASWGTLITILMIAAKPEGNFNALRMFISTLFVSLILIQVIISGSKPYRLSSPIWEQNIPTKVGEIGTIKMDKKTNKFVLSLLAAMQNCNININRTFLGFYNLPGVALVLQAVPVSTPWLSTAAHANSVLENADPSLLKDALVGINLWGGRGGSLPKLPERFTHFPSGYTLCGDAIYPYEDQQIQLWAPNN
jgi:hypothetical protein